MKYGKKLKACLEACEWPDAQVFLSYKVRPIAPRCPSCRRS